MANRMNGPKRCSPRNFSIVTLNMPVMLLTEPPLLIHGKVSNWKPLPCTFHPRISVCAITVTEKVVAATDCVVNRMHGALRTV